MTARVCSLHQTNETTNHCYVPISISQNRPIASFLRLTCVTSILCEGRTDPWSIDSCSWVHEWSVWTTRTRLNSSFHVAAFYSNTIVMSYIQENHDYSIKYGLRKVRKTKLILLCYTQLNTRYILAANHLRRT